MPEVRPTRSIVSGPYRLADCDREPVERDVHLERAVLLALPDTDEFMRSILQRVEHDESYQASKRGLVKHAYPSRYNVCRQGVMHET